MQDFDITPNEPLDGFLMTCASCECEFLLPISHADCLYCGIALIQVHVC